MLSKRIEDARRAFIRRDVDATREAHDPKKIQEECWHKTGQGRYIGPAIYGAIDGIITTFAVVAGVAGAGLAAGIVLILGLANLLGDGISMAMGDFLSARAEEKYRKSEEERERWEIACVPDGEREEIRQIYLKKGITGEALDKIVEAVTGDEELWVQTMMAEELGMQADDETVPLKSAAVTFVAFVVAGFMPLLAYVFSSHIPIVAAHQFATACIVTGITLFTVGAARVLVTGEKWYFSGLEMLMVGGISAGVAYLIGHLLRGLGGAA